MYGIIHQPQFYLLTRLLRKRFHNKLFTIHEKSIIKLHEIFTDKRKRNAYNLFSTLLTLHFLHKFRMDLIF